MFYLYHIITIDKGGCLCLEIEAVGVGKIILWENQ